MSYLMDGLRQRGWRTRYKRKENVLLRCMGGLVPTLRELGIQDKSFQTRVHHMLSSDRM